MNNTLELVAPATYRGTSRIQCIQPPSPRPSPVPTVLEVSLDGQVYGSVNLPYEIIGPPSHLGVFLSVGDDDDDTVNINTLLPDTSAGILTRVASGFVANGTTPLPVIQLKVLDVEGHRLGVFDEQLDPTINRVVEVTAPTGRLLDTAEEGGQGGRRRLLQRVVSLPMRNGTVEFRNLALHQPTVGDYHLTWTELSSGFTVSTVIHIEEGDAYRLSLTTAPGRFISSTTGQVVPTPGVGLQDFVGNPVGLGIPRQKDKDRVVTATLVTVRGSQTGAPTTVKMQLSAFRDGGFHWETFEVVGAWHGITYRTVFASPELVSVFSPDQELSPCAGGVLAQAGSGNCVPCPVHGRCNGTVHLKVVHDHWRANSITHTIYRCPLKGVCTGDTFTGDCFETATEAYEGAVCNVCPYNFGRNQQRRCARCPQHAWENAMWLTALTVAVVLVLAVVVVVNLRSMKVDRFSILLKLFLTHLQVSSKIGDVDLVMPSFLRGLLNGQKVLSAANPNILSFDCATEWDFYQKYVFLMCVPPTVVLIALGVTGVVALWWRSHPEVNQEASGSAVSILREGHRDLRRIFAGIVIIVLFLAYPMLTEQCALMFDCRSFEEGGGVTTRLLWPDLRQDCDLPKHLWYRVVAGIFTIIYGVGIPCASALAVHHFRSRMGPELTTKLFTFLVKGYRDARWDWEVCIMIRKLAIVYVVVFVRDPRLQLYCAIWVVEIALGFHLWLKPYTERLLTNLEAISLLTIIITLNLALLYFYEDALTVADDRSDGTTEQCNNTGLSSDREENGWWWLLTILILILNLGVIILFLYWLYRDGKEKFKTLAKQMLVACGCRTADPVIDLSKELALNKEEEDTPPQGPKDAMTGMDDAHWITEDVGQLTRYKARVSDLEAENQRLQEAYAAHPHTLPAPTVEPEMQIAQPLPNVVEKPAKDQTKASFPSPPEQPPNPLRLPQEDRTLGSYTFRNGDQYDGQWKGDKMDGKGRYVYATTGNTYEGAYQNHLKHGYGVFAYKESSIVHQGMWVSGEKEGWGKTLFPNGDMYEGQFAANEFHGKGVFHHANGDRYDGEWQKSVQHGYATMNYVDGTMYRGTWENGKKNGHGTLTSPQSTYEGEWVDGKMHGNGVHSFADGSRYQGEHRHNMMHGRGVFFYADGSRYDGDWVRNVREGRANYYYTSGARCTGTWQNNDMHGPGEYITADNRRIQVLYQQGKCLKQSPVEAVGGAGPQ